jgi:hypothetical protein
VKRVRLGSDRPYPARFLAAGAACSVVLFLTTGMFLPAAPDPSLQAAYARLPLSFEENRGQAPADVGYLSRTSSGVLFLRPGSFSLDANGRTTPCVSPAAPGPVHRPVSRS